MDYLLFLSAIYTKRHKKKPIPTKVSLATQAVQEAFVRYWGRISMIHHAVITKRKMGVTNLMMG